MKSNSIFSPQFVLLCSSGLLFFGSFNMIMSELPSYLEHLGGGDYKGLIVSLFTLAAALSRPFSGKLADKVGRVPVMVVGAVVTSLAAWLYPFFTSVWAFFFLRFFHGFSTGFKPTGTSAYVADLVPPHRRGEAMGIVGFFSSMGMASGPAMGSFIASKFSLTAMFHTSSALAMASVIILIGMKETLENRERLSWQHFRIRRHEIFEPAVLPPALLMMLCLSSYGTILTTIPDLSDHLMLPNRGLFFTFFTVASLMVRIVAGKVSDRHGRVPILRIGCLMLFMAFLFLAHTDSQAMFVVSAVLFGFGIGICSPTIFAWTIDLSDSKHIGRGIATMYIALEVGIGAGALLAGGLYDNHIESLSLVFYAAALPPLIGGLYLYSKPVKRMNRHKQVT